MKKSATASGTPFQCIYLDLLSGDDYAAILAKLFPNAKANLPAFKEVLIDMQFIPRILLVFLWSCSCLGKSMQLEKEGRPETPKDAEYTGPVLLRLIQEKDIDYFLCNAKVADMTVAFKKTATVLPNSGLFVTLDTLKHGTRYSNCHFAEVDYAKYR